MPAFAPLLPEDLPVRCLSAATQVTANTWRNDNGPVRAHLPKGRLRPVTLPNQILLGNG